VDWQTGEIQMTTYDNTCNNALLEWTSVKSRPSMYVQMFFDENIRCGAAGILRPLSVIIQYENNRNEFFEVECSYSAVPNNSHDKWEDLDEINLNEYEFNSDSDMDNSYHDDNNYYDDEIYSDIDIDSSYCDDDYYDHEKRVCDDDIINSKQSILDPKLHNVFVQYYPRLVEPYCKLYNLYNLCEDDYYDHEKRVC
jgi:hypothetical protein